MHRRLLVAGLTAAALLCLSASAHAQSPAGLVINEIDYDQAGTDTTEFVEIRNNGSAAADLDPYTLRLVNGNAGGSVVYTSVNLPAVPLAAGATYVVCGNQTTVTECDLDGGANTDFIQNGAPDAVGLVVGESTLVDAVSYEGTVPGYTEGAGAPADSGSANFLSISRIANSVDTNDNAADFRLVCSTPGAANAVTAEDCTDPNGPVEPVLTRIHDIQGNGAASPIAGSTVTIQGIVTTRSIPTRTRPRASTSASSATAGTTPRAPSCACTASSGRTSARPASRRPTARSRSRSARPRCPHLR
jgi:predicted extracellular nuclease